MRTPFTLLALSLALLACGEEPSPRHERRPEPAPSVEQQIETAEDDLVPPPPSAWPTDVESLADAVRAFESVDTCLADLRARTPTEVAEGIADLGYDAFLDDLCRGMAAVKSGTVEACDALDISAGRAACRRRLAIVHGEPTACPNDRVTPGRDAVCVAWAARDPGLCRASSEDVRCRAVLAGDERVCRALRAGDRDRCHAEVRRYASALGDQRRDSPATHAPAVLTLDIGDPATHIARHVLERGVRLVPQGCAWSVALASPLGEPSVGLPGEAPTFHVELEIQGDARAPIDLALGPSDAVLSVFTPALGGLTSIAGAQGTVTIEHFEPRLGGALEGTLEGTLRHGEAQVPVHGRFATFVRDLDPLPAYCSARP